MYATTQELITTAVTLNSENIKQRTGIQLNFILEDKFQKEDF